MTTGNNPGPATTAGPATQNLSANRAIRLLASSKGVTLNAVGDSAVVPVLGSPSSWSPLYIIFTNASVSLAQAYAAVYTGPAASGTGVLTAQALSTCSGSTVVYSVAPTTTVLETAQQLYFRCTTINTAAATVDMYVFGYDFS